MNEQDRELEAFSQFIGAIQPWLGEVVLIGGWAHRMYRQHRLARKLDYLPLTTLDADVAVPPTLKAQESAVRQRLLDAGFEEEFVGEDRPPTTHYHYGKGGGFYAEFLTPLIGSEHDRRGKRKATTEIGGISSQFLRYIEILMISPWKAQLGTENGYPFSPKRTVRIVNATSFLAQKILIHEDRVYNDRAKDLLYIHDTIEVFSEGLEQLRTTFQTDVAPKLHPRRRAALAGAADRLFGKVNDTIREASRMAVGRKLSPESLAESSRAGLGKIFHS